MSKEAMSKVTVVLGSGGHTGEMLKLLKGTDLDRFEQIDFIVAESDKMSLNKIEQLNLKQKFTINQIKRSRSVGQSYLTSIFTTLISILYTIPIMVKLKPNLLLVNGPGTCIPVCLLVFLLSKVFKLNPICKIVYIESICRVKKLSLSGKILYYSSLADSIIVQWPELAEIYSKTVFLGRLV